MSDPAKLKVAFLTGDNREPSRDYGTTMPYFGTAPEALLQGFAAIPEIEVHVVTCTQKPMKSPEKLADNIWFHSLYVPKVGWMRTSYQGCIRTIRRRLKVIKPDIVHGQGTERECAVAAVFSKFPNVLTIHGNMRVIAEVNSAKPFSFYWLAAQLEKIALAKTNGVVCITNYTRDTVKQLAPQTWLLPNAVDQTFFDIGSEPDGTNTMLCVGTITYRKNQNAFIRALDSLAETRKFKVIFMGQAESTEPYAAEFLDLVAKRPWCEFVGFEGRQQLKTRLKTASIVVLPSLEDNCPMAVLEGAAAGVPVLAANVGGVPDLITAGENGYLCDPLNEASMRDGVGRILDKPDEARKLAKKAHQQARERFHPVVIARRHLEIYHEVLSKPS